jgi:hypothetical protein
MIAEMLVLEESEREYRSRNGMVKEYVISARDAGKEERCTNNFVYALSSEEIDRFKGKLRDNKVRLVIKEVRARFNGEIQIVGRIEAPVTGK